MRILCVCAGGNVRSAQLAFFLKNAGHDAIAVGILWNTPETVAMLTDWAELITVAEEQMIDALPEKDRHKVTSDFVVGPDRWGIPIIPDLLEEFRQGAERHGFSIAPRPGGLVLAR